MENFNIVRYIVENPDLTQLNEILQKYIDIHNKKYGLYQVRCLLKVNYNQYFKCKPLLNLDYITYPYITFENQTYFSQVLEMRITCISTHRPMTYDYYLKKPKLMCEIELNQLVNKNPEIKNSFYRYVIYPFIQEFADIPGVGPIYIK